MERTDGIPLFVEEMTKAVLEAEGEGEARRTAGTVPSPTLAVPASLHASLMARLDRLGPAKELAQIGAAIGREFSHALLAAVVRKPEAELLSTLDRLMAAGLLSRQGVPRYLVEGTTKLHDGFDQRRPYRQVAPQQILDGAAYYCFGVGCHGRELRALALPLFDVGEEPLTGRGLAEAGDRVTFAISDSQDDGTPGAVTPHRRSTPRGSPSGW